MQKLSILLSFCFSISLLGCSSITVKTDYDREVNFSRYRTFKWMPYPKNKQGGVVRKNSLLDKRIRRAVESELSARGFDIKRSGRTDAVLAYHLGEQQRVNISTAGYSYRWPRGRRVVRHRYKEGTLILDIVDPRSNQLVWRGAAVGVIGHMEESEEKISEAVLKIFEKYPPQ